LQEKSKVPIAFDPTQRLSVVLATDADKELPPTFYVRPLTLRETRAADTIDQRMRAAAQEPGSDPYAPLLDGIRVALVGWTQVTDLAGEMILYDPAKLEDVLTIEECFELMQKIVRAGALLKDEKKSSASLPSSSTASSASSVPTASA